MIDSLNVFAPPVTLSTVRQSMTLRHRLGCFGSLSMTHTSPQNKQCSLKLKSLGVSDQRKRFSREMSSFVFCDAGRFEDRFKCSFDTQEETQDLWQKMKGFSSFSSCSSKDSWRPSPWTSLLALIIETIRCRPALASGFPAWLSGHG